MTTTIPTPPPDDDVAARGIWASIPRGAELDARSFGTRHRILLAVLTVHLPALAGFALVRGVGGWMVWGQLAAMAVLLGLGIGLRSQVARASAVAVGLMAGADVLVYVYGGLTDLHILFYVLLVLVALYQYWAPFLLAVAFVAVHHISMSIWMPMGVFSTCCTPPSCWSRRPSWLTAGSSPRRPTARAGPSNGARRSKRSRRPGRRRSSPPSARGPRRMAPRSCAPARSGQRPSSSSWPSWSRPAGAWARTSAPPPA